MHNLNLCRFTNNKFLFSANKRCSFVRKLIAEQEDKIERKRKIETVLFVMSQMKNFTKKEQYF